jgi:thiol-disulfide isomerase/thioredoxin
MPVAANLPQLPLVCLKTADLKNTKEVTKGKNTVIGTAVSVEVQEQMHRSPKNTIVSTILFLMPTNLGLTFLRLSSLVTFCFKSIDFWTTKCTKCPDALDKLDDMAGDPKYQEVQFISICCDRLDGARDIIEKEDDLRWQNIHHYFMSKDDKETAKKLLGFKNVPFYVVLDDEGNIQQSGDGKQVDFDDVPGIVRPETLPTFPITRDESPSVSSFDDVGLGSDDEICLAVFNKLEVQNEPPHHQHRAQSNHIHAIDVALFDDDDF